MSDDAEVKKLMAVKLEVASKMLELQKELIEVNKNLVKLGHVHLAVGVGRNW